MPPQIIAYRHEETGAIVAVDPEFQVVKFGDSVLGPFPAYDVSETVRAMQQQANKTGNDCLLKAAWAWEQICSDLGEDDNEDTPHGWTWD
jgi:hypothetical protein